MYQFSLLPQESWVLNSGFRLGHRWFYQLNYLISPKAISWKVDFNLNPLKNDLPYIVYMQLTVVQKPLFYQLGIWDYKSFHIDYYLITNSTASRVKLLTQESSVGLLSPGLHLSNVL